MNYCHQLIIKLSDSHLLSHPFSCSRSCHGPWVASFKIILKYSFWFLFNFLPFFFNVFELWFLFRFAPITYTYNRFQKTRFWLIRRCGRWVEICFFNQLLNRCIALRKEPIKGFTLLYQNLTSLEDKRTFVRCQWTISPSDSWVLELYRSYYAHLLMPPFSYWRMELPIVEDYHDLHKSATLVLQKTTASSYTNLAWL